MKDQYDIWADNYYRALRSDEDSRHISDFKDDCDLNTVCFYLRHIAVNLQTIASTLQSLDQKG